MISYNIRSLHFTIRRLCRCTPCMIVIQHMIFSCTPTYFLFVHNILLCISFCTTCNGGRWASTTVLSTTRALPPEVNETSKSESQHRWRGRRAGGAAGEKLRLKKTSFVFHLSYSLIFIHWGYNSSFMPIAANE